MSVAPVKYAVFYCQMFSVFCKDHFSCIRKYIIVQLNSINEVSDEFKFDVTRCIENKSSSLYNVHVYGASLQFNTSQQMNEFVVDRLVPLSSCTVFV